MRAERPADVTSFLKAFENHARKLVAEDKDGRNADIDTRVAEQIFAPWEHNQENPKKISPQHFYVIISTAIGRSSWLASTLRRYAI